MLIFLGREYTDFRNSGGIHDFQKAKNLRNARTILIRNPWGNVQSPPCFSTLKELVRVLSVQLLLLLCCCCWVTKSCLTLCDPKDYSPQGSSVYGILQARILEWVAISFSRGSSWPRDRTTSASPALAGRFFSTQPREKPTIYLLSYPSHSPSHSQSVSPAVSPVPYS